jgi:hypothetical protein
MPGTPIRGESGCQAPPVNAPCPQPDGRMDVNPESKIRNSKSNGWLGGKSEIRNDMMTGSSNEPSQNVILSEARRGRAKSKDLRAGGIPNSEFRLPNLAKGWA